LTKRAFIIGIILSAWANLWPAYVSLVVRSSRADHAHLPVAMLIPFVTLIVVNGWLGKKGRGLSASELLTVCCMSMVAACMQGEWLSGYLLGMITAPYYFASAENRWDELLLNYMPDWTLIPNRALVRGFYEGLPPGDPVPWIAWVTPVLWWGFFLGALLTANLCLSVLFRKQWMEHEKLAFPIATVLLQLTGASEETEKINDLIRNRAFRIGFAVTLGITCWNITSWFIVGMPVFPFLNGPAGRGALVLGQGFPNFVITLSVLTLTFGYFTRSEILFSIWFFHFLAIVQAGIFNRFGFDIGSSDIWCSFHPAVGWQSFGGMITLVGWGIWIGRDHFRNVLQHAFGRKKGGDREEMMSYRTATILLVVSIIFAAIWLNRSGMGWPQVLAFGFATIVLYLGLSRIIIESGLVYLRGPITAQAFTWHLFGIARMGPLSAASLALSFAWSCDAKTFAMTMMAHVPRLGAAMSRISRRPLVPAILVASLVGTLTVMSYVIYAGYHATGGFNFGTVSFMGTGSLNAFGVCKFTAARIQEGTVGTDWTRISFMGIGAGFTLLMFWLRYQFPGFPIHPIGFTISAAAPLQNTSLTIFFVWLIKTLLLKIGGLEQYRATAPLFLGITAGFLAGVAFGVVVDTVWFPGQGHEINLAY
jgi:hypothetical protein